MTIISVDPSVAKTGLVVLEQGRVSGWKLVDMRPRQRQKPMPDPGRLVSICNQTASFVASCGVDSGARVLLVIEDCIATQGASRVNIALHWMLRTWIARNFTSEALVIAPATLKKFATGTGNAEKGTVGAHVQKRWGTCLSEDATEDVLEALALAKLGQCWVEQQAPDQPSPGAWTSLQAEVARYRSNGKCPVLRETEADTLALGAQR